jgi:hypothetical protein
MGVMRRIYGSTLHRGDCTACLGLYCLFKQSTETMHLLSSVRERRKSILGLRCAVLDVLVC